MSTDVKAEARAAAAEFRRRHHLGTTPIGDLVTVLESLPQVHVAVEPANGTEQHGMRATDQERGVTVLAASATPHAVRLRSTLAHELAHHIFNDPTPLVWSENTPEEERATEFARHLLIPVDGLTDVLGAPGTVEMTDARLSQVVEWFAVSPKMASIQLNEAGFINDATAGQFGSHTTRALATRYGWLPLYRQWAIDSSAARPPRRILAASINAYLSHDATVAVVATVQGATIAKAKSDLDAAGVIPPPQAPSRGSATERENDPPRVIDESVDWSALDGWDSNEADDPR